MKTATFFPYYSISSDIVKAALGMKDKRSIAKHFRSAGVEIFKVGTLECVAAQDLFEVSNNRKVFVSSQSSKKSGVKEIDDLR